MKHIILVIFCLSIALLAAQGAPFYPTTTLIENFGASWCGACAFAQAGLNVIEAEVNPGEINIPRLLTESPGYSFDEMDERFEYYGVLGFPAVFFNGKLRVDGSDDLVADGTLYRNALNQFRYLASPIKMSVENANHATGDYSFKVTMMHPEQSIEAGNVVFYLVEDNVAEGITRLVRHIQSQTIDISGQGNFQTFNFSLTPSPAWNTANLWAVAFVQMPAKTIIQSVSTLPEPEQQIRVAVPFDLNLVEPVPLTLFSPFFYVHNLGPAGTIVTSIDVHSAPSDWYLNYCDEDGACLPGFLEIPHTIAENGYKTFDLNVIADSEGLAVFDFVIQKDGAETYRIPFSLRVGNVSNNDAISVPMPLSVKSAWPNPFKTALSFELHNSKAGTNSNLFIYNSRGQRVSSLPLKNLQQGSNLVNWEAQDLPNGIYFYRLEHSAQTGKILKLR